MVVLTTSLEVRGIFLKAPNKNMKLNIKKTFATLAFAITLVLAFSLPAFSQDTCTPDPPNVRPIHPDDGT
jgi:hypothetical protein